MPIDLTTNMTYDEAIDALHEGKSVRLPEWVGYWFLDPKDGGVKVFTRTGEILDTPHYTAYAHRTDWQIVKTGLGLDFAILALKAGKLLARTSWPLGQFIFVRKEVTLPLDVVLDNKTLLPDSYQQKIRDTFAAFGFDATAPLPDRPISFSQYLCQQKGDAVLSGYTFTTDDIFADDWTTY